MGRRYTPSRCFKYLNMVMYSNITHMTDSLNLTMYDKRRVSNIYVLTICLLCTRCTSSYGAAPITVNFDSPNVAIIIPSLLSVSVERTRCCAYAYLILCLYLYFMYENYAQSYTAVLSEGNPISTVNYNQHYMPTSYIYLLNEIRKDSTTYAPNIDATTSRRRILPPTIGAVAQILAFGNR